MNSNKISSYPPTKKPIEEFILGAEQKRRENDYTTKQKVEVCYPWNDSSIRTDVQKVFTVKLPEEYLLKIKYISDTTNKSQQKIVREIVCQEIDKMISKLI